ncbi:MAG: hypothetical protein ACI9FJ_002868, partial [Alteromonadaceae bacterium]
SGALLNVFYQRRTARESNSLTFQQSLSDNEIYNENIPIIMSVIKNRKSIHIYAEPKHTNTKEAQAIRSVLNTWERAANAMRHGVYDELYLYQAHRSMVLHFGVYLRGYIKAKQAERESFLVNFSWLVLKWTIRRDSFEEAITKKELKAVFKALNRVKAGRPSNIK